MDLDVMAQILLTLVSVSASTICAYLLHRLQEQDKRRLEEARAQERERQDALARQAREYDALRKGVLAVLRDRIVQSAIHFHTQGYASAAQKDNLDRMYEAYHALGGNGTATHAMEDIMHLPFQKEG